jgi:hypothetical protein
MPRVDLAAQPTTVAGQQTGTEAATTASAGAAVLRRTADDAGQMVALRVARALADGNRTVTVALRPAELGNVQVRLSFTDGGKVAVQMTMDRQETFDAFRHDRAALEGQFQQAGIDLGAGGLDLRFGREPPQNETPQSSSNFRVAETTAADTTEQAQAPVRADDSLLDIIA